MRKWLSGEAGRVALIQTFQSNAKRTHDCAQLAIRENPRIFVHFNGETHAKKITGHYRYYGLRL